MPPQERRSLVAGGALTAVVVLTIVGRAAPARAPAQTTPSSIPPLTLLDDRDYPPHSYLDNGIAKGSEIDVAEAIARAMGREARIELVEWSAAQQQVLSGGADGVIDLSISDERRKLWDFSEPIFTHEFGLFVRTSEIGIHGVRDLAGMHVGVVSGSFPAEFLRAAGGVSLVPIVTYDDGFSALNDGTLDVVAADTWVGAFTIQQRHLTGLTMAGEPFATRQAGIAVRKGNTALLAAINRAVRTLTDDGTLARIHDRWKPQEIVFVSRERMQRYVVWGVTGAVVLVVGMLVLWIVMLRRHIQQGKAAAEALRSSEERFEKAFLASPNCIAISDFERGVIDINQRFEELTGYSRSEIIGRNMVDLNLLVDPDERRTMLERIRAGGSVRDGEFRLRRKDGDIATMLWSAETLQLGGRPCFLTIVTDITERRRLETSLQQASEINRLLVSELRSESLYAAILESLRSILRVDYAGVVLYDEATKRLELRAHTFYEAGGPRRPRVLTERTPSVVAMERGQITLFNRAELETFGPVVQKLVENGIQTFCGSPLIGRSGPLGVLTLGSRRERAFSADDLEVIRQLSAYVAIAIANAQTYDEVTELKNRLTEEKLYLEEQIRVDHGFENIIGGSPALLRVLQQIETVAPTTSTVLLLGETGTGKELLARAVHDRSAARDHSFIKVNAAALPATLLESELFGYERGAFTGAVGSKVGRFELAHRGTLFLDEIGDVPLELQPKLLRALQEREFERLGGTRTIKVDVRLIAATNRDLEAMSNDGTFRKDLFYRLNVFPIHVPPLRDRPEDIPILVGHFVQRFSAKLKRRIDTIPSGAMATLQRWTWPGNIRELENVIERAVILSQGSVLEVDLGGLTAPAEPAPPAPPVAAGAGEASDPAPGTYAHSEREAILRALRDTNGIIAGDSGAAARLGLKRTTLQSKMRKLGIKRPSF